MLSITLLCLGWNGDYSSTIVIVLGEDLSWKDQLSLAAEGVVIAIKAIFTTIQKFSGVAVSRLVKLFRTDGLV